ncbi:succinylglutamate desuccinylase/aspartoacylase domain-containing protein [Halocatena marina]|uniref:succinylglutamate desuccinylase/aspartoacylase domain-containing protein n=1 Tax=Halocatena marina TaxID=2934937 RepID=UPI00200F8359|nr:succinylglutamate desuccinylase/aspartoacylase family protein [Halocatena marina]
MPGARHGRRAFLATAAAVGAGIVSVSRVKATGAGGLKNACTRRDKGTKEHTLPIDLPDLSNAIDVDLDIEIIDSGVEGPTAFVVGGLHGDEEAGVIASHSITNWSPDAGQIVVLPEANPVAIENNTRGNDLGDLNRKFRFGQLPSTKLAQSIWNAVSAADPDILLTLQESRGIRNKYPSGVGQTVFSSPGRNTSDAASLGLKRANRTIGSQKLKFGTGPISGPNRAPNGLLAEKAAYEAGIPSFIVETFENVNKKARVSWQKKIVGGILDYYDIYD